LFDQAALLNTSGWGYQDFGKVPRTKVMRIPMAETRDVVELILQDHRKMEELFRLMRSVEADRAAALREFSDLLIAHALAEEAKVYPALKRYKKIDDEEVEHGEEEHEEGNKALLELLEVDEVGSQEWDERLEDLVQAVTHHADEEERTILNGARENVVMERREELGEAFVEERERQLKQNCGAVDNVRRIVSS
jgi:DNA phosphorothioation-dependent restriction protein DptG